MSNYQLAITTLTQSMQSEKKFKQFVEDVVAQHPDTTLGNLLILPVKRITKYVAYLTALVSLTREVVSSSV